jgi:GLTT repeat (6 copies)
LCAKLSGRFAIVIGWPAGFFVAVGLVAVGLVAAGLVAAGLVAADLVAVELVAVDFVAADLAFAGLATLRRAFTLGRFLLAEVFAFLTFVATALRAFLAISHSPVATDCVTDEHKRRASAAPGGGARLLLRRQPPDFVSSSNHVATIRLGVMSSIRSNTISGL